MKSLQHAFDQHQSLGRKPGNTAWCQCPSCDGWFHLGPSILAQEDILLHCPHCHDEFASKTGKRIIFPNQSDKS